MGFPDQQKSWSVSLNFNSIFELLGQFTIYKLIIIFQKGIGNFEIEHNMQIFG